MPLIPLYDANPRRYIRARYVTIGLVVVNFGIFLTMLGMSAMLKYSTRCSALR